MAMITNTYWLYVALVGVFTLGMFIGIALGKRKAMAEMMFQQQRMEATRMWTESMKDFMGGQNGKQ